MHKTYFVLLVVAASVFAFVFSVNDFLSVTERTDGEILILEGWIWHSAAIQEALSEFAQGRYRLLVIVGGPAIDKSGTSNKTNSADLAAERLEQLGLARHRMVTLQVPAVDAHRTYSSALTIKQWIRNSEIPITRVNVFTRGAHARKSLVLFRRALGPSIEVGVISGIEDTYDPHRWWLTVRGINVTIESLSGYVYALLWPLEDYLVQ